jgi:hypothetical protein
MPFDDAVDEAITLYISGFVDPTHNFGSSPRVISVPPLGWQMRGNLDRDTLFAW